jgi:DNA polymerase
MTATEKMSAARFLDAAAGYLGTGYFGSGPFDGREPPVFSDDPPPAEPPPAADTPRPAASAPAADTPRPVAPSSATASTASSPAPAPAAGGRSGLESIAAAIRACEGCPLCSTRHLAVPGEGAVHPLVLVVGEGPGADEDASGRPFVGAAGQLLDKMLLSIGLERSRNCFIANVVKCRPPGNRDPLPAETAACLHFFESQFEMLKPRLVLTVGKVAAHVLLGTDGGTSALNITRLRGNWRVYRGVPLLPSFHPSYLLRDASQKQFAWEDLKALCRRLADLDPQYAAQTAELRKARGI